MRDLVLVGLHSARERSERYYQPAGEEPTAINMRSKLRPLKVHSV